MRHLHSALVGRFASGLPAIIARRNAKKAGKGRRKKARSRACSPYASIGVLSRTMHIARPCEPRANNGPGGGGCAGASGLRMCVCASRKRGHARTSFPFLLSWGIRQRIAPRGIIRSRNVVALAVPCNLFVLGQSRTDRTIFCFARCSDDVRGRRVKGSMSKGFEISVDFIVLFIAG